MNSPSRLMWLSGCVPGWPCCQALPARTLTPLDEPGVCSHHHCGVSRSHGSWSTEGTEAVSVPRGLSSYTHILLSWSPNVPLKAISIAWLQVGASSSVLPSVSRKHCDPFHELPCMPRPLKGSATLSHAHTALQLTLSPTRCPSRSGCSF